MMSLQFYNGRAKGAKFVHKAILTVSDPYTHVELVFSDGVSFSSELRIGPRFKQIGYSHPDRWRRVDLPFCGAADEARVRYRADLLATLCQRGLVKYDTAGAILCAATGHDNPWNFFCSEVVYEVLAPEIAVPVLNHKMHPQRLLTVVEIITDLHALK